MVTNTSGTKTSKHLGLAIFTRPGEVAQGEMKETIIVPISPDSLEGRASAFGGNPGDVFIERAAQYWNVAPDKRPKIRRLVAVLTKAHVILGSWEVDPSREWKLVNPDANSPYNKRIRVPVPHPENDNVDGIKDKYYVGDLQPQGGYSPDIAKPGPRRGMASCRHYSASILGLLWKGREPSALHSPMAHVGRGVRMRIG